MSLYDRFTPGIWQFEIDVRDFIQKNYKPYEGDDTFLVGPTERTKKYGKKFLILW